MRRKVVAGNWKMNMLPDEAMNFINGIAPITNILSILCLSKKFLNTLRSIKAITIPPSIIRSSGFLNCSIILLKKFIYLSTPFILKLTFPFSLFTPITFTFTISPTDTSSIGFLTYLSLISEI